MSILALSLAACGGTGEGFGDTAPEGSPSTYAALDSAVGTTGSIDSSSGDVVGGDDSIQPMSTAAPITNPSPSTGAGNASSLGGSATVGIAQAGEGAQSDDATQSRDGVDMSPSLTVASCTAATPPGAIETTVVTPESPVSVSKHFMGMHIGLHVPSWKAGAFSAIPAPTYRYGYTRTLKVEVDGQEERGFWLNIETSPGTYDWRYMDKWMAANEGHPVIWLIAGMPSFYAKYPGEQTRWPSWPGSASPPSNDGHQALKRYAQAVKARYGNQIAAFEVWNEPTLPWTGFATDYDGRWSPSWGQTNAPWNPAPFFSGSASDLANIAFTLNQAQLGVPVLGAAFVDQWGTYAHSVTRFLNAPITLPGGYGTGKDHIQGLSMHYYDYSYSPSDIIQVIDGYREKLRLAGVGNLPIWGSETGAESGGRFVAWDSRAPLNVQRWVLLGAAKGLESLVLYGHVSEDDLTQNLGNPIDNPAVVQSLREAAEIMGSTICNAAVLTDKRVWVTTADGKVFLK